MQDELFWNKVAAAALTTALLFFGLPILVNNVWGGGHHGAHGEEIHDEGNPLGLAYPIEFTLEGGPAADEVEVDLGTLLAEASVARGQQGVIICQSCHTFDQGGATGTGPNLYGIIGRDIASVPGFAYTPAMSAMDGVWTYEKLDALIENSAAYVPGTSMAQRISKDEKRADILAYMQTQADDPVPFPEPAPPAEEMVEDADAEGTDETMFETPDSVVDTAEPLEDEDQFVDDPGDVE